MSWNKLNSWEPISAHYKSIQVYLIVKIRQSKLSETPIVAKRYSHVIGFDDGPFAREHRGDVLVVGVVFSGLRMDGLLSAKVRRDGVNSTRVIARLLSRSRFAPQIQLILLQGIAFAGFNVIDIHGLHQELGIPVVVVSRKPPNFDAIRDALLHKVPGGHRKWALISRCGEMEPAHGVYVQRCGIDLIDTTHLIFELAVNGSIPEPLRMAHIIAGGVTVGESRHRV